MTDYSKLVKEAIKATHEKAEAEKKAAKQAADEYIKFEVGATYATRSICDSEFIFKITIIKRTEKTVTIDKGNGKVQRCKIHTHLRNAETIYPYGIYSMCPVIDATEKIV